MRRLATPLALLALAACRPTPVQPFDPFHLARIEPPPDARAPLDGAFRDQQGRPATLRSLAHGQPILLAPVQYLCPNLCGLTLVGLTRAVSRQPKTDFSAVALGIDPREGPREAAKTASDMPMTALTGPAKTSRAVTDALGYHYAWDARMGQYAHLSAVAVLAGDGRLVRWLAGPQIDPADLSAALEQARGAPPQPLAQRLFLLCYHLVARGGTYDRRIIQALQFAGGLTVVVMLLALRWMTGREGRRTRP